MCTWIIDRLWTLFCVRNNIGFSVDGAGDIGFNVNMASRIYVCKCFGRSRHDARLSMQECGNAVGPNCDASDIVGHSCFPYINKLRAQYFEKLPALCLLLPWVLNTCIYIPRSFIHNAHVWASCQIHRPQLCGPMCCIGKFPKPANIHVCISWHIESIL